MDREQRLDLMDRLQADNEAARERLAERQRQREDDPAAMQNWLLADRRATGDEHDLAFTEPCEPVASPSVTKSGLPGGLIRKITETARARPAVTVAAASTGNGDDSNGWNDWVKRHLENERAEVLDLVVRMVGQVIHEMRKERAVEIAALRRELTQLRSLLGEREERAAAVAEVKRQYAQDRGERDRERLQADLASRDAKIEKLEMQVRMLCQFLSVSGYDLPRGI